MHNTPQEGRKGAEINVTYLAKMVLAKWWIFLLAALIGAVLGFFVVETTKTVTYSSSISFVVSNRLQSEESGGFSNSDLNASITLANTYKYILSSRTMCEKVAESSSYDTTPEAVKGAIHMSTVSGTNIILMKITTGSATRSYDYALAVIKNYNEVVERSGYSNTSITVCEMPIAAKKPNADRSGLMYALIGMFVAVMLTLIVIMIMQLTRHTIQSADDISSGLDLRVLGLVMRTIPHGGRKNAGKELLMDEGYVGFSFVETFKAIRTKIENEAAKRHYKVILVSSAGENEGKTIVATNLAIALAQTGHSVLLVDADLRKPSICKLLGLSNHGENRSKGLQNILNGSVTFEQAIRYVERHKIFLLAGSGAVSDPAELLSMPQTDKALRALRKEFDYVIIDTAPAGVVTDASILSNYADAAVLVVREDYSNVEKIRNTIDDLAAGRADLIGCVYNNVTGSGTGRTYAPRYGKRYGYGGYGGYGYGYRYGYGYGYEPDAENEPTED